jgi:phospholipase C
MKFTAAALALLASTALGTAYADEGTVPLTGVPQLEHVFVIMMENHGYGEVINNPEMPWTNAEAASANLALNYFAVAHPSLTNYLEVVGGSNFGILDDSGTIWGNTTCASTLTPAGATNESSSIANCPIAGTGMDTATPLIDYTNETSGPPGIIEIDDKHQYPAASTIGKTIADQLVAANMSWKTYQESLPITGAYGVTTSDGHFTDQTVLTPAEIAAGETTSGISQLYRVKHNPFAYFASIASTAVKGQIPGMVAFDGVGGLYADLASGNVPNFSFIVPNQCDDQHGTGSYQFCSGDPNDNGTLNGLNPGLMAAGDQTLEKIVTAIKASPVWTRGRTAIVITWDESDYSVFPITNQVTTIVDKNYGVSATQSTLFYTHFSLLKSIEAGFRLPCLNHACDASTRVMSDLFR